MIRKSISATPAGSRDRAFGPEAAAAHVLVGFASLDNLIADLERALEIAVADGTLAAD